MGLEGHKLVTDGVRIGLDELVGDSLGLADERQGLIGVARPQAVLGVVNQGDDQGGAIDEPVRRIGEQAPGDGDGLERCARDLGQSWASNQ